MVSCICGVFFRLSSLLCLPVIVHILSFILLSLFLLIFLFSFPCERSCLALTYIVQIYIRVFLCLFPSFSLVRGRHSVAFCLYLSATGRLFVAQPLYIKRQGVCYFPPLSRDARWFRVVGQQQALASYGFVTESILYTAFYLRVPILCTFSFRSFAIFIFIHFRLSRSFLYYFAYKCISSLVSFSSFSSPPLSAAALSSSVVT